LHEEPKQRGRQFTDHGQRLPRHAGWEVVERLARRQHDPADPGRGVAGQQLDQRSAGVVADQRHIMQVKPVEEFRHQARHPR